MPSRRRLNQSKQFPVLKRCGPKGFVLRTRAVNNADMEIEVSGEPKNATECLSNLHHEAPYTNARELSHVLGHEARRLSLISLIRPSVDRCYVHGRAYCSLSPTKIPQFEDFFGEE